MNDEMIKTFGRYLAPDEPLRLVRWGNSRVVWAWQRPARQTHENLWLLHTGQVVAVSREIPPWIIAGSEVYRARIGERHLALPVHQVLLFIHPPGLLPPAVPGVFLTPRSFRVRCTRCGTGNIVSRTALCEKCGEALIVFPAEHRFRESEQPAGNTIVSYSWQCPGCRKTSLVPVIRESVRCQKCGGQFDVLGVRK